MRIDPAKTVLAVVSGLCVLCASGAAPAAASTLPEAVAPKAPSALPAKRVCAAPFPGRAACMAERLLIEPAGAGTGAAPTQRAGAGSNNKPFPGFLTPELLHEAYDLPTETPEASSQTIALIDAFNDPTAEADLGVFDSQFGLPACTSEGGCFKKVNQEGNAAPLPADEGGWASEISIDVQTAHAICPGCHILLVEANSEKFADLGTAVNTAAKLGATVISNSYGGSEEGSDTTLGATYYTHPASVLVASSGDCGYLNEACGLPTPVDFPAASSGVVAVGGTSLSEASGSWSSAAWDEGGSGCSTVFEAGLWQATAANFAASGCKKGRAVADVSAIGDPGTGVNIYDSTPEVAGEKTGWGVWGGTSVSAPIVAAEFALAGGSHGVLHPAATLYSHLGEASTLYDVSSGTNGKCAGATICSATGGYDGPTGVGSPVGLGAFEISGSPKSTAQPTISGTLEQGQTLSESHGGWTGTPTSYSYQWERCGAGGKGCLAIAGATAQSYLLAGADAGLTIRVRETADNAVGSGGEHSAVTAQILSDVPSIASFGPVSGITGSKLAIAGSALSTATQLIIGKRSASFVVLSPTTLEATVPDGALAGKVSVTTAHGTATSKGKFKPTFAVDLLKPLAGAAGTTVAIKGVGFNSSSKVSFAGTPAITTFVSGSKLKAIVPAGAGSGHVTVTNTAAPAGTVRSAATFTP